MARLTFLHIGLPKTGTTFLQTRMWNNRPLLRAQGISYPGQDRMDFFHGTQVVREHRDVTPAGRQAWERVMRQVHEWDGVAMVSHEFFCLADREQAQRLVDALDCDVHVVVTARDYARQFQAIWQEALKVGHSRGLDEFIERTLRERPHRPWGWDSQDLPEILERWSQVVPRDRLTVITVPQPGAPRELLWQRWCQVTGIDDTGFDLDGARANESLGAAQAALLERVQPVITEPLTSRPGRHRWLRQYFGHEVLGSQRGERFRLAAEHHAELTALNDEAIEDLRRRAYTVVGDLSELRSAPYDASRPHPDHLPPEDVLDTAALAIERMIVDVKNLSRERDDLRRELRRQRAATPTRRARSVVRRGRDRARRLRQRWTS